jgi:hypothetical protein
LEFSRLHLPRPLEASQAEALLVRLAADRAGPLLAFEARADYGGTRHLFGAPVEHLHWVQRTMRHLVPGLDLEGLPEGAGRPGVSRAVRLRIGPRSFALAADRAELTSAAVLSALHARLEPGEQLVLQLLLGRRIAPRHLPTPLDDPTQPWWALLTKGRRDPPRAVREQIDRKRGQHGFAATIRIGVSAATPERSRQLIIGLLGALSTATSRGVYLDLRRAHPAALDAAAAPRRWPLRLAAEELSGLLSWPLGEAELPGVAALHPRLLRVPAAVAATERVFAQAAAPGPARLVGIGPQDSLGHLVAVGPTGSGKSNVLLHLIGADIAAGRPVLVIDPKRQLVDDILERAVPEERIDDVVILDPAQHDVPGLNPLDVGGRDPDVVVDGLLAVFAAVFASGWGPRTQDILHSGLLTLARASAGRAQPHTLLDLPRLLAEPRFRTAVLSGLSDDPALGSFWAWFDSLAPAAQAQVVAAPLNKLRQYLLRPALRAILGQPRPQFRLRDLFRDSKIVLVPLNEGLIGPITAQLLGSLIIAEAWSATLERASETNPTARPASVVVDELQNYLHLPTSIGDALAQSRSLGVAWHLAHQARSQLTAEVRAAVDSNAKTKIFFAPNDPDDARDFARQAPQLQPVDFQSLGRFMAYSNINSGGAPAGWCSIRTLPPPGPTGLADRIREASRRNYAATASPQTPPESPAEADDPPVGRKRRTP